MDTKGLPWTHFEETRSPQPLCMCLVVLPPVPVTTIQVFDVLVLQKHSPVRRCMPHWMGHAVPGRILGNERFLTVVCANLQVPVIPEYPARPKEPLTRKNSAIPTGFREFFAGPWSFA